MSLFLIVSEIYGRKLSKWWKILNFFELFDPPCRIALADLDGSKPECAQVSALHIEPHLEALIKIEIVAVHCTNEITPVFWVFKLPLYPPPGADGPQRGKGHVGRHYPYTYKIWCGSVHALLRYRSKATKIQKFPLTPIVTKISFSLFRPPPPGAANPQKGRRHPEPEYPRMQNLAWSARGLSRNCWPNKKKKKKNIQ